MDAPSRYEGQSYRGGGSLAAGRFRSWHEMRKVAMSALPTLLVIIGRDEDDVD
jgi:hypothetical protein